MSLYALVMSRPAEYYSNRGGYDVVELLRGLMRYLRYLLIPTTTLCYICDSGNPPFFWRYFSSTPLERKERSQNRGHRLGVVAPIVRCTTWSYICALGSISPHPFCYLCWHLSKHGQITTTYQVAGSMRINSSWYHVLIASRGTVLGNSHRFLFGKMMEEDREAWCSWMV